MKNGHEGSSALARSTPASKLPQPLVSDELKASDSAASHEHKAPDGAAPQERKRPTAQRHMNTNRATSLRLMMPSTRDVSGCTTTTRRTAGMDKRSSTRRKGSWRVQTYSRVRLLAARSAAPACHRQCHGSMMMCVASTTRHLDRPVRMCALDMGTVLLCILNQAAGDKHTTDALARAVKWPRAHRRRHRQRRSGGSPGPR